MGVSGANGERGRVSRGRCRVGVVPFLVFRGRELKDGDVATADGGSADVHSAVHASNGRQRSLHCSRLSFPLYLSIDHSYLGKLPAKSEREAEGDTFSALKAFVGMDT